MRATKKLKSVIDSSKNWIIPYGKGNLECRFVQRDPSYFISYVSSHSGCNMGCKFCHLTQLNQTSFKHTTLDGYKYQVKQVIDHYNKHGDNQSTRMNVNFMARGEPLANKIVVNKYDELYDTFKDMTDLEVKPNISTIMPYTVKDRTLSSIFKDRPAYLYYSLYSLNKQFRDHWMPNALPYITALDKLKEYQEDSNNIITFHMAFIKDNNDDIVQVKEMADIIKSYDFNAKFNLVRYNPHTNSNSTEATNLDDIFDVMSDVLITPKKKISHKDSRIIDRIGYDVKASCGMFVDDSKI
jgi:23S rRNA (adenine2503-C2)-methyltransferase